MQINQWQQTGGRRRCSAKGDRQRDSRSGAKQKPIYTTKNSMQQRVNTGVERSLIYLGDKVPQLKYYEIGI